MEKHQKKRLLAWVLLLSVLLSLLVGCDGEGGGGNDTAEGDARTKLVDNGKAVYSLVYSRKASTAVQDEAEILLRAIEEVTGVKPESRSDRLDRGAVYDSSKREILFGKTEHTETQSVLKGLEDDQFAICEVGNKLVITSPKDANLGKAVSYFIENFIPLNTVEEPSGNKSLLASHQYTSQHDDSKQSVLLNGKPIEQYTIVYESARGGYSKVATELQDEILAKYGIKLPIYIDSRAAEAECEILVGKTNRQISQRLYNEKKPQLLTYEVIAEDGKIQLLSGGVFSMGQCVDRFYLAIKSVSGNGNYFATELIKNQPALAEGADLRVMTSNVLAARWVGESGSPSGVTPSVAARAEILAGVLASYQPDVLGLQEFCDSWAMYMPEILETLKTNYGIEYTWLHGKYNDQLNMTSILYRSDKYELLETAAQPVSYWGGSDYYIRLFAWARLKEKAASAKEFIVINTHWELSSRVEKVQMCIDEEIALIQKLRAQYGVPIICTGDFNSKQDTEDYIRFTTSASLAETRVQAKENDCLLNTAGGCGTVGTVRKNGGNYIDHIYVTAADCETLRYETVVGNMTQYLSDHSPHVADIKFK